MMVGEKTPWDGVPEDPDVTRYHWVRHHGATMRVPHLWLAPQRVWDDPALADTIAPADFASICDYEGPVDTPDEVKALRSRLAMFVENLVGHQEALQNAGWEIVALRRALGLNPAAISAGWIEAMDKAAAENARLRAALRSIGQRERGSTPWDTFARVLQQDARFTLLSTKPTETP